MEKVLTEALTFDDVLVLPMHSDVLPKQVSLKTKFTKNIDLNLPFCSAAMDTVTEAKMAIALASLGGIGIIHKNNSPEEQAAHHRCCAAHAHNALRNGYSATRLTGRCRQRACRFRRASKASRLHSG